MNIKKKLFSLVKKNTYIADMLYKSYKFNLEKNIKKLSENMSNYDTIDNVNSLIDLKKDIVLNNKPFYSYNLNETSNRLYGIHSSIFSSINDKNIYFPSAEHGLIFHNKNWSDTESTLRASCLTFSQFRKSILQQYYQTPIFCVGPYIHYAQDYYTPTEFERKKEILGKNLLVFPTHSTDDSKITYEQQNFIDIILEYKRNFDSVTICAFWWNIDDPLIKFLKKLGCNIVSAGYREDKKFLSRLKAIIQLSDFTIGDSIGTHIGYCLYLNKPFSYFPNKTDIQYTNLGCDENIRFITYQIDILKKTFIDSKSISPEQLKIANYYWGFDQIKSTQQITDIYNINKIITKNCLGFVEKYGEFSKRLLDTNTNLLTEQQIVLLRESLI